MGHFDDDIDYTEAKPVIQTKEGYLQYLLANDDELPENFYTPKRRSV